MQNTKNHLNYVIIIKNLTKVKLYFNTLHKNK
jgi:hypothetical protein